jgi:hypothetical protein
VGYILEGRLVEICSCASLCPCWAGLDADDGACHISWIFHFDHGHVDHVDMAGTNMGVFGVIPGNAKDGNGRIVAVLDEKDSEEQHEIMRKVVTGGVGGPLGELAKLIKEVVAFETADFEFDVDKGTGTYRAGRWFGGESENFRSPLGRHMEIRHSALAPVLGDPAYPGRVVHHHIDDPTYGMEFTARQSTQTTIRYVWV